MKGTIESKRIAPPDRPLTPQELRDWMTLKGISKDELAAVFGVTDQAVNLWLIGARKISITNSRIIRLFMKYPQLIREF